MKPIFFKNADEFRKWLEKNHLQENELLVGFWKVKTGKPSITWSESVDEAICFGWIDGVRKSIDEDSYTIRFTPRKPTSIWSAINIKKVEELAALKKMKPAGIAAFEKRKAHKSAIYSYEKAPEKLSEDFLQQFKANKAAWKYFEAMPPSYRKPAIHWVMTAKQENTRIKRMSELINDSANGKKVKSLSY